jgi:hypothetical protein
MTFSNENVLFASLLGSKITQQLPRFETIQNELGKRVLPPIPFLPINNKPVVVGYPDYTLENAENLWRADRPKSQEEQFFPLLFVGDGGQKYLLPYEPMVSISSKNNIVKRTVAKSGDDIKRQGTVKERWSRDDYEIKITGVLIGSILRGDVSQCFPKEDFLKLKELLEFRKVWGVECEPLQLLGINKLVVEDMSFPFTKGENVQAYEMSVTSDFDYDLLLEEDDVLQS